MPWHVAQSDSCPASKPWACVKDATGEVEGCHATEADAHKQMAALYANEPGMDMPMEGGHMANAGWYRIGNYAPNVATEVYLYDELGAWGVSASDFVRDLQNVRGDIDLHINSPGGEVFDAVAIYNSLRKHPGKVTVHIDGIAASAASFIAMAGDRIVAERNATMMIHEAMGIAVGNASDMNDMASLLEKCSENIAGIYADRAGGPTADWRTRMQAETWYTAEEAKTAGLVDEIAPAPTRGNGPRNRQDWDLSVFRYPGRSAAPTPTMSATTTRPPEEPPPPPPPTVVPESPATEPGFFMPPVTAMRDALEALEQIPFDFDLFRAAVSLVANDAPASDPIRPADPEPPEPELSIDLPAFRRSIREARL